MTKIIIYKELDIVEELNKIRRYHYDSKWSDNDFTRHTETNRRIQELISNIEKAADVMIEESKK